MHQPKAWGWAFEERPGAGWAAQRGQANLFTLSATGLWVLTHEIKEELGGPSLSSPAGWGVLVPLVLQWDLLGVCFGKIGEAAALAPRLGCEAPTCGSSLRKGKKTFLLSGMWRTWARMWQCGVPALRAGCVWLLVFLPGKKWRVFMAVMVCSSSSGLWECAWMCRAGSRVVSVSGPALG